MDIPLVTCISAGTCLKDLRIGIAKTTSASVIYHDMSLKYITARKGFLYMGFGIFKQCVFSKEVLSLPLSILK